MPEGSGKYHYRTTQLKIQEEGSDRMIKYDRLWDTLKEKGISQYKLIKDTGMYLKSYAGRQRERRTDGRPQTDRMLWKKIIVS